MMMYPVPMLRITTLLGLLAGLTAIGCAASKEQVRTARTSGYKADFAIVYSKALNVVRARYQGLVENAVRGTIRTSWHPIRIQQQGQNQSLAGQQTTGLNPTNAFGTTTVHQKQYFVRFDVYVLGGKPWRIRIDSYASEWEAGAVPTVLSGANVPPWLKGRTDALYVEIYNELARYAVPLKIMVTSSDPKRRKVEPPKPIDLKKFGKIPAPAARSVHHIIDAAKSRDFKKLREGMADEFTWNLGATPSAKAAIVTWQADARVLERLIRVLEAGCRADDKGKKVLCPGKETAAADGYSASFAVVAGQWKMTAFAAAD